MAAIDLCRPVGRIVCVTALAAGLIAQATAAAQSNANAAAPAAQEPPASSATAQLPAFEVVSIKPNKSGSMESRVMFTPDGISVSGLTVHMLLREALGVSDSQITGEPGWLGSSRFDIEAKVAADDVKKLDTLKPKDRWAMLLPVFEDRFGLKFHSETKDLTQYVLLVAKGGLKMKEAAPDQTYANGLKTPDGKPGRGGMMRVGPGELVGQSIPVSNLVRFLSFQFHGPVLDKTGLTGNYDMNMTWTPDESEGMMMHAPDGGPPSAGNPAPPPSSGPSIFTALEEQLGLKLEAHKEPGTVIVIDHIDQPSAN